MIVRPNRLDEFTRRPVAGGKPLRFEGKTDILIEFIHLAELLAEHEGISVSPSTIRCIRCQFNFPSKRKRRMGSCEWKATEFWGAGVAGDDAQLFAQSGFLDLGRLEKPAVGRSDTTLQSPRHPKDDLVYPSDGVFVADYPFYLLNKILRFHLSGTVCVRKGESSQSIVWSWRTEHVISTWRGEIFVNE